MGSEAVTFGGFQLDLKQRALSRAGAPVKLGSRALEILCVLASAKGDTVSKDELMARVWPGLVVEENNIEVHVSTLRKALVQDKNGHTHIVTEPGRGYRLTGIIRSPASMADAAVALALPDKPSIAVLAFKNMTSDPDQEYFAEGMAEDIITELSRIKTLFVIARNSSFLFRGNAVDVRQVGRDLGVRYVLEGSIRRTGTRLRTTAQLIDAETAMHVWADRYDRDITDVFEVQDEITTSIVSTLHTEILLNEGVVAERGKRPEYQVWDLAKRGLRELYALTAESMERAHKIGHEVIAIAPDGSFGYDLVSCAAGHIFHMGFAADPPTMRSEALQMAEAATLRDPRDEFAHWLLGIAQGQYYGRYESAFNAFKKALEINPSFAVAYGSYGTTLAYAGFADEGIEQTKMSMRLNPLDPSMVFRYTGMSFAHFVKRDFVPARDWAGRSVITKPHWWFGHALLAANQAMLGQQAEAETTVKNFTELFPDMRVATLPPLAIRPDLIERLRDALRVAGLPD